MVYKDSTGKETKVGDSGACSLPGEHNLYNLSAAIASASAMGVAPHEAYKRSLDFHGVEHRLEKAAVVDGVAFYDDSSSTTPESTLVAIKSFNPPPVLIIGGRNKGMDVGALSEGLKHAAGVVLIGEMGRELQGVLDSRAVRFVYAENMAEAVGKSLQLAKAAGSKTVALSPAFASFDMFKNYRHRGQVFKEEVRKFAELQGREKGVR